MGNSGYVTFVRCDDLDSIEKALTQQFKAEGYTPERWWRRKRDRELTQSASGEASVRWGMAIGRGRNGWGVICSAPPELLAEPSANGERTPRIGALARTLQAEAVHASLYDEVALLTAEATAAGEVTFSGFTPEGTTFHGIELSAARAQPRFERVGVPAEVRTAVASSSGEGFGALLEYLAGDVRWSDVLSSLVEGESVPVTDARVLWFSRDISRFKRVQPLRVALSIETHPLSRRIVLRSGKGEMWLNDRGFVDAPDRERGAHFVDAIAVWLGQGNDRRPGGVPRSDWASMKKPASRSPRPGFESLLVSLGEHAVGRLLVHLAPSAGYAELEEVNPLTRGRLVRTLRDALEGTGAPDSIFTDFKRVATEPSVRAEGCFAGSVPVVGVWRLRQTAVYVEDREYLTLDGMVTAIAGWSGGVALTLTTPELRKWKMDDDGADDQGKEGLPWLGWQLCSDDSPARLVVIDLSTGSTREVLRSDKKLNFGSPELIASPDGSHLAVSIARGRGGTALVDVRTSQVLTEVPGEPVLWDRDGLLLRHDASESSPTWFRWKVGDAKARRVPGTFVSPDEAFVVNPGDAELYEDHRIACLFSGPHEVVLEKNCALDLQTKTTRRLFGPDGMEPVAFTADGSRCLGKVDDWYFYVGRRKA